LSSGVRHHCKAKQDTTGQKKKKPHHPTEQTQTERRKGPEWNTNTQNHGKRGLEGALTNKLKESRKGISNKKNKQQKRGKREIKGSGGRTASLKEKFGGTEGGTQKEGGWGQGVLLRTLGWSDGGGRPEKPKKGDLSKRG